MTELNSLRVNDPNPFRAARAPNARDLYDALKSIPISTAITHPTAMPVVTAPLAELAPFFDDLIAGGAAQPEGRVFRRGARFPDGRLDLCKQVVGPEWIGTLVDATRIGGRACGIEHFLLGNNVVGDNGATRIASLVSDISGPQLKTLYLAGNAIGPEGLATLASVLEHDDRIEGLWLKRNPLGSTGGAILGRMLAGNRTLLTLDLVNTGLLDAGVEALMEGLADNHSLRTLYLDANGLTATAATAIAAYFDGLKRRGQTGLTGLFLGLNRMGDPGAACIAEALTGYAPLVRFDIGANRVERAGLQSILAMAAQAPSLQYLGIGLYKSASDMGELPNWFGADGAADIADFIRLASGLLVLEAKDCHLDRDGVERLAHTLEDQHTLLDLRCTQYGIRDAALYDRIEALLNRNSLAARRQTLGQLRQHELRLVKHGPDIGWIDSIYRNAM
jgi:Ran GTPase-activating protein (RanGAP) involved in mRNA processing and transport